MTLKNPIYMSLKSNLILINKKINLIMHVSPSQKFFIHIFFLIHSFFKFQNLNKE